MKTNHIKHNLLVAFCVGCGSVATLTSCDDLFEPAIENNQEISQMYGDPTFARGMLENAYMMLGYDTNPSSDVATDDAVTNNSSDDYKGNHSPSPLKMKLRLPLIQLMFSKPSSVISTRSLAPLFQMRQTSFGHIRETKGTGEEMCTTEKSLRARQNSQAPQIRTLTLLKGQER